MGCLGRLEGSASRNAHRLLVLDEAVNPTERCRDERAQTLPAGRSEHELAIRHLHLDILGDLRTVDHPVEVTAAVRDRAALYLEVRPNIGVQLAILFNDV